MDTSHGHSVSATTPLLGSTAEQEQNSEDLVQLHQLCDRCREFFKNWEALNSLLQDLDRYKFFDAVHLATIRQLLESQDSCHFCSMVVYKLSKLGNVLDRDEESVELEAFFMLLLPEDIYSKKNICIKVLSRLQRICFYVIQDPRSNDIFCNPGDLRCVPRHPTGNLDRIAAWLDACRLNHKACSDRHAQPANDSKRPTRILELTESGARLRSDTRYISESQYIALSHRWGEHHHQLRLTKERVKEFEIAIPWNELPDLFKEAVRVTRHTGFKYLWIDSLCIIQDSPSDWETEAAAMTTVYSNAFCSLAFLLPPGRDLVHFRKDPRPLSPCKIYGGTAANGSPSIIPSSLVRSEFPSPTYSRFSSWEWPLFDRAWTFQEHLLSPRTILYGLETIMWECEEVFCDELAGTWLPNHERLSSKSVLRKPLPKMRKMMRRFESTTKTPHQLPHTENLLAWLKRWSELVCEYKARAITVPEDRTMAFAGVAQAFSATTGLTYLAGIWTEFLLEGLLWHVKEETEEHFPAYCPPKLLELGAKLTPSWSWFSCPRYDSAGAYYPVRSIEGRRVESFFSDASPQKTSWATLESFQWPNWPVNVHPPYASYNLSGLRITLHGATFLEGSLHHVHSMYEQAKYYCRDLESQFEPSYNLGWHQTWVLFDDIVATQHPDQVLLLLLQEMIDLSGKCEVHGLALVAGSEPETWKRVGTWFSGFYWPKMYGSPVSLSPELESETCVLDDGFVFRNILLEHEEMKQGKRSLLELSPFLHLEGVKMESITLV